MDPVVLNETVLVGGYFAAPSLAATICDRTGACATPPLFAPSPASVKFVVPLSLAGASTYAVTLRDADGAAAAVVLNAPRLDWWRGDAADTTSRQHSPRETAQTLTQSSLSLNR